MISRIACAAYGTLLGLKLAGVVDWSWWLVLAPFWLVPALAFTAGCAAILWLFALDMRGAR